MPSRRLVILYLFLAALGVRVVFVATRSDELVFADSRDYDSIARNLLKGEGFHEDEGPRAARPPVYPLVLAAFYAVGLDDPRAVYLLQALAGAATCVLVVLLGRRLFGERVGVVAGWIMVFYPFFIYFTGLLLTETLFILGLVAFVYLVEWCGGADGGARFNSFYLAAAAGVLAGVVTLLRSSFLVFPIFVLPFWLASARYKGRAFAQWAAMLVFAALTLVPWVWRNHLLFDRFIPTTLQVGESLYEANSPYADGGPAMERLTNLKDRFKGDEVETNRYFRDQAVRYILENPQRFLSLAAAKFRRFWSFVPNAPQYGGPLYAVGSLCTYVPVLIGAVFGIYYWRRRKGTLFFLLSPVIYYTALHMVFVGSVRYRVPVMPFVILLAAAGLVMALRGPAEGAEVVEALDNHRGPRKRRHVLRWLLLGLLLAAVATGWMAWRYFTHPEKLRLMAIRRLVRITNARVKVEEARFGLGDGLTLTGIQISDTLAPATGPVLHVGTVRMEPYLSTLLTSTPLWRTIELENVGVNAELDETGGWRFLNQLKFEPPTEGPAPEVFIAGLRVRVAGLTTSLGDVPAFDVAGLNATLRRSRADAEEYHLEIWSEESDFGHPHAKLRFRPEQERLVGEIAVSDAVIRSDFVHSLPPGLKSYWQEVSPDRIHLDANGKFSWDAERAEPFQYEGDVKLHSADLRPRRVPCPITKLRADVGFQNRTFRVRSFSAAAGEAKLSGSGSGRFMPDGAVTAECTVKAQRVTLDERFRDLFPPKVRDILARIKARASGDVDAEVRYNSTAPAPEVYVVVDIVKGTCEPPELPFPLKEIRGRVTVSEKRLTWHGISGSIAGAPFNLPTGFTSLEPDGPFSLVAYVRDLKLHAPCGELMSGLPKAGKDWVDQMPPALRSCVKEAELGGKFDVWAKLERQARGAPVQFECDVSVDGMKLTHPRLGHPLEQLSTRVHVGDGRLDFTQVTAGWGQARIEVPAGRLRLDRSAAKRVELRIRNLFLSKREPFYQLLPPEVLKFWEEYDPEGMVSDAKVVIARGEGAEAKTRIDALVHFKDAQFAYHKFPYRLEQEAGVIEIADGIIAKWDCTGRHGPATVHLQVFDEPFRGHNGTRLEIRGRGADLDGDLRRALGERYQKLWQKLKVSGKFDLDLTSRSPDDPKMPDAEYSAAARIKELSLDGGAPVRVAGGQFAIDEETRDGAGRSSLRGRIALDEALVKGNRLTNVAATYHSDGQTVRIEDVSADCYGGKITGSLTIPGVPDERGAMVGMCRGTVALKGADVVQILKNKKTEISGKFDATGEFSCRLGESGSFRCKGTIKIREGEIGQLPGMLAFLNLFRLCGLDAPAFHTVELVYEIVGKTLYAREINLLGPIVSLYGKGEIAEDGTLNFRFRPQLGPEFYVPFFTRLVRTISENTVPVTVRGKFDEPVWGGNWLVSIFQTFSEIIQKLIPVKLSGEAAPP